MADYDDGMKQIGLLRQTIEQLQTFVDVAAPMSPALFAVLFPDTFHDPVVVAEDLIDNYEKKLLELEKLKLQQYNEQNRST
jgi:hypothetical protein